MMSHEIKNCKWINNQYYIINQNKQIEIYDKDRTHIKTYNIPKDFTSITFDDLENTFYFSEEQNSNCLYKSNDFENFEKIKLNNNEKIINIFYCKKLNSLLITTTKKIILFNIMTHQSKILFEVKLYHNPCDCTGPLGCNNDKSITLLSAVCCDKKILVAYRYKNKSFISELKNNQLDEVLFEIEGNIIDLLVINNEVWALIQGECYTEIIYTGIDCGCEKKKECNNQIVESIASIEKSIAKILDSESLKIKSAIEKSEDVQELICVNTSVKEMIYYVTILEFLLSEKLKNVNRNEKDDCC